MNSVTSTTAATPAPSASTPVAPGRALKAASQSMTPGRRALRRFGKHKLAMASLVGLMLLLFCALAPAQIAPYDPLAMEMADRLLPPSTAHFFGTDDFGRD